MMAAGAPDERAAIDAMAALVAAIGGADFPRRFLDAMRVLAGVELCSVFRREGDQVALMFAEGDAPHAPDFPERASRDYARGYWRSDALLTRLARGRGSTPIVVRRRACEIADPAYRAACYERAAVSERVSIVWPGRPALIANGYRTMRSATFTARDIERLEHHAGLLIAALQQHLRAGRALGDLLGEPALVETLLSLDCRLSPREAEIAAAMILGRTQQQIAEREHLSAATIVTYRRRAYGKLGIANRRDLNALHRRLMAGAA